MIRKVILGIILGIGILLNWGTAAARELGFDYQGEVQQLDGYISGKEIDAAVKAADKLLADVAGVFGDTSEEYGSAAAMIGSMFYLGEAPEKAVIYWEKGFRLFPEDSEEYEELLNFLSMTYVDLGDEAKVMEYYALVQKHNERELAKECTDPKCYADKGLYYYQIENDVTQARDNFLKAIAMIDATTSAEMAAAVYLNYASFLSDIKDDSQAGEYYEQAANAVEGLAEFALERADNYFMAGLSYSMADNLPAAIRTNEKAVELYSELKESTGKYVEALTQQCDNYRSAGEYDKAQTYIDQANRAIPSDDRSVLRAIIEYEHANLLMDKEDYAEALPHLQTACEILKDYPDETFKYQLAMQNLTHCQHKLGDKAAADESLAAQKEFNKNRLAQMREEEFERLEAYKEIFGDDSFIYGSALGTIGGIYHMEGDHDKSLDYLEPYFDVTTTALTDFFRMSKAADRMAMWTEIRNDIDSIPLYAINPDLNRSQQKRFGRLAYDALLFSKGIMLNSSIEFENLLRESGNTALLDKYHKAMALSDEIAAMTMNLDSASDLQGAQKEIAKRKNEYEQLQNELMKELREYGDYTKYLGIKWREVQQKLREGEVAIEFACVEDAVLPDRSSIVAYVITPGSDAPEAVRVITQGELTSLAESETAYSSPISGEMFWGKLDPYISDATTIYFSPDGILHKFPVEYFPYKNETPLAFQKEMHRLSSTKELAIDRNRPQPANAALFGDIDYYKASTKAKKITVQKRGGISIGGFGQLDYSGEEITNIASSLRKANIKSEVFTKQNASKKQFMNLHNSGVNIIHLSTHGNYDSSVGSNDAETAMQKSVVVLAGVNEAENIDDSQVTAAEIGGMNLRGCDLAVLSACVSGQGTSGADGLYGLQRGFKNAGVLSLLMTLEEVNDEATMKLISRFYENLTSGKTKHQSLIEAQKYLINEGYPEAHYWAPFILLDAI